MPTALTIRQIPGKPGQVYYPLELINVPSTTPTSDQVLIHMTHCALNHRDLFIRQHLYPGTSFGIPLLADGCGVVVSAGSSQAAQRWLNKRVVINPGTGWKDSLEGPESKGGYRILGGTKLNRQGTAVTEFVTDIGELEEAPEHLNGAEAAALSLTGLTAWRATNVKADVKEGQNVLVTGIGGGVAIMALLFAVHAGANVWVTSGSDEKIQKAVEMGAKGGVIYKEKGWEKKLLEMLPQDKKVLDSIIDGAGSDVVDKAVKLVKPGGIVSIYGMTTGPKMPFTMAAVLKNIEIKGSTMGSRREFSDMFQFVREKKLKPVISKVAKGLDNLPEIETLFDEMKNGSQFGKLVIEIAKDGPSSKL